MAITDFTDQRPPAVAHAAEALLPLAGERDNPELRRLLETFEDAGKRVLARIETDDETASAEIAEVLRYLAAARDATQSAWHLVNG